MTNDVKQTIDWGKPIEAVHEDGRVSQLWLKPPSAYGGANPDDEGQYWTDGGELQRTIWNADGSGCNSHAKGWRIRNAIPATPESAIPAALVERMVGLVRFIYRKGEQKPDFPGMVDHINGLIAEARAIVADPGFPVEVDSDLVEARKLAAEHCQLEDDAADFLSGNQDDGITIPIVLAALRRGRALARGEG